MNSNDTIKSMVGAPSSTTPNNPVNSPALKDIATNGKLLIQNVNKLTTTLHTITKLWGAP